MRETARGVAAAKIKRAGDALGELCKAIWAGDFREGWHWEIPANHEKDTDCIIGDGLEAGTQGWAEVARLESALTAERERAERAERERDETRLLLAARENDLRTDKGIADWNEEQLRRAIRVERQRVVEALAERDTLRERVAVLRAECQAGRAIRDREVMHEGFHPRRDTLCIRCSRLLIYDEARAATDAAGAMGEVGRG